jgi:hypothetical protein
VLSRIREVVAVTSEPPSEAADTPQAVVESTASELQHITDLHGQGALTDDEFTAVKAKILGP